MNQNSKKVLIFCPKFFGYQNIVAKAFRSNGYEVDLYNKRPSDGFIAKDDVLEVYEASKKDQYGQYLKDVIDGKHIDIV